MVLPESDWVGIMKPPKRSLGRRRDPNHPCIQEHTVIGSQSTRYEPESHVVEVSSLLAAIVLKHLKRYRVVSTRKRPRAGLFGGIKYSTIYQMSPPNSKD